ncbi:MAG: 30S ribosomal protein S20, partial [candidate division NC10 bacterium]|nr:30S ribosomal protein S20 [candidate division NC10 bacterium]
MPNIASAKKRLRQAERRAARNRAAKTSLRTKITRVRQALEGGDLDAARAALAAAIPAIDRTASRGVIHRRTAARYKSRLMRRL